MLSEVCRAPILAASISSEKLKKGKSHFFLNEKALFHLFLTRYAVGRPWNRIQPFGLDVLTAVHTFAENALGDPIQRFFNQPECIALISALREQKLFSV